MKKFTITFARWATKPYSADVAEVAIFRVAIAGIHFPIKVQMADTLYSTLIANPSWASSQEALRDKMLLIALPRLKAKLNHLPPPMASTDSFLLTETFGSGDTDEFLRALPIQCQFQEKSSVGFLCRAAAANDELVGKTTSSICAACDLPSDALRCTNLQHPSVIETSSSGGVHRHVVSAFCDMKSSSFQHQKCIPSGNDCWRQEVVDVENIGVVTDDIAERVIDELQYLNLTFRQAFKHSLIRLNDLRLVSQVLSTCRTQEDFTTKVACLTDILNNLDLSAFTNEIGSEVKGSLNRLQTFLKARNVLLDTQTIDTLKNIVSIRNSFPIHSGNTQFLVACHELQVEYPPVAWEDAWGIVLHNAWRSLRTIRMVLPDNS